MTLDELSDKITSKKYSNIPMHARPRKVYRANSANELTKAILAYFELKGIKAWRQASEGRYLMGRSYHDLNGRVRQEKGMYIPRFKGGKGAGDITATIPPYGRRLEIEIKWGKDRLSEAQKEFKEEIESMGAVYMVTKTWEDFIFQIEKILNQQPLRKVS